MVRMGLGIKFLVSLSLGPPLKFAMRMMVTLLGYSNREKISKVKRRKAKGREVIERLREPSGCLVWILHRFSDAIMQIITETQKLQVQICHPSTS